MNIFKKFKLSWCVLILEKGIYRIINLCFCDFNWEYRSKSGWKVYVFVFMRSEVYYNIILGGFVKKWDNNSINWNKGFVV